LTLLALTSPDDLDRASDHDLLLGGVTASIAENQAHAITPTQHPSSDQWHEVEQVQYSGTEVAAALRLVALGRGRGRNSPEVEWEVLG